MFSALSEDDQREVIDQCLDPLLRLAEKGFYFGLQISGVSLEIIYDYRPDLIKKISKLIQNNNIDFIGNGYAQIIQPLFPHELNVKNQLEGIKVYKKILGVQPEICTINEMAYSVGSCESLLQAGYKTILMEWNNANSVIKTPLVDQYKLSKTSVAGKEVNVLWCDTVAFQKFQKYTHGEIGLEAYCTWLEGYTEGHEGALCVYCSDAEIFGFRPKRYGTEITPSLDEWGRIELLMERLKIDTILPRAVDSSRSGLVQLTDAKNPIIVKKQPKYNINRWAVTGKNDQQLNTFCYRLLRHTKSPKFVFSDYDWRQLLKLASSDLRTHIEDQRWKNASHLFRKYMKKLVDKEYSLGLEEIGMSSRLFPIEIDECRGNNIISWPIEKPVLGRVEAGFFSDIRFMADFYSGFVLIEKLGHRKISDLDYKSARKNTKYYNEFSNVSGYEIKKSILSTNKNSIDVNVRIKLPNRTREQVKPCNFSLTSEYWDIYSLYYAVNLGGVDYEKFEFGTESFDQDSILNLNVVGTNGFCPTDGVLIIGDKDKSVRFETDPTICFSLIRLSFEVLAGTKFLLQICYVAQDVDETFKENPDPQEIDFKCKVTYQSVAQVIATR